MRPASTVRCRQGPPRSPRMLAHARVVRPCHRAPQSMLPTDAPTAAHGRRGGRGPRCLPQMRATEVEGGRSSARRGDNRPAVRRPPAESQGSEAERLKPSARAASHQEPKTGTGNRSRGKKPRSRGGTPAAAVRRGPKAERQSPGARGRRPGIRSRTLGLKAKARRPMAKAESQRPNTVNQGPVTRDEKPRAGRQRPAPRPGHQAPAAQSQKPRRPTSTPSSRSGS